MLTVQFSTFRGPPVADPCSETSSFVRASPAARQYVRFLFSRILSESNDLIRWKNIYGLFRSAIVSIWYINLLCSLRRACAVQLQRTRTTRVWIAEKRRKRTSRVTYLLLLLLSLSLLLFSIWTARALYDSGRKTRRPRKGVRLIAVFNVVQFIHFSVRVLVERGAVCVHPIFTPAPPPAGTLPNFSRKRAQQRRKIKKNKNVLHLITCVRDVRFFTSNDRS